jgi:acyl-coenzyme A synthetase/AMP-(fatty) acid ligase
MAVETPAPDRLLGRLRARLDGATEAPIGVLDPAWPVTLRHAAASALEAGLRDGRVGDGDLVVFTSGSSGRPKAVVRTVQSWAASLPPLTRIIGLTADDVVWLPLPLTSGLSLYGGVHAQSVGARIVPGGPRTQVPVDATVTHVVPALLDQVCSAVESGSTALRTAVVAGSAPPTQLLQRARAAGLDVIEYYGAAELSFVGWRRDDGPFADFPGAAVQVRDDDVWVRSPYLCRGYLDPATSGPLQRNGSWATVGDRGRRVKGGWQVLGRGDAAVTTGGHTVVAEEVEAVVSTLPGVRDVAVVGLPHAALGQVLAAVVALDAGTRRADLTAGVQGLPAWARPQLWLLAPTLPRTATGKLARGEITAAAAGLPRVP